MPDRYQQSDDPLRQVLASRLRHRPQMLYWGFFHENDWEGVDNLDPIPLSTQSSAPLVTKLEAFASEQNLPEAREGTSCILNDYWQYL